MDKPRSKVKILILAVVVLIAILLLSRSKEEVRVELWLNEARFEVELAQTPSEQTRGLSGRASLEEDTGLLFVYPTTNTPSFWMKEMNFPVDIIWLDENKKVVGIEQNISPDTFPHTFSPTIPIKYVLEIAAGSAARNNLEIDNLIHFSLPETL